MTRKHALSSIVAVLLLSACASFPTRDIQVEAQADPKANFSGYKTYAWLGTAAIVNDPHGQWEPPAFDADAEIKYLIDRELRARNMSESTTNPDLIVAFAAGVDMEALGLKTDPETKMTQVTNVPQGSLVIALVDSETGFAIWLGVASAEVQDNPDEKTVKARLNYAVTRLFQEMPR
ncbi:MAG: DUF4136 domain-containing protein [Thermodesulfobacteriota bacterium]